MAKGKGRIARLLPIAPGDLTDPERAAFFSERARLAIIADGIAGTPMVGWKNSGPRSCRSSCSSSG